MVDAGLYFPTFMYTVAAMCMLVVFQYINSPDYRLQEKGNHDMVLPFLLCLIYAIFLGSRPISGLFGDTIGYFLSYMKAGTSYIDIDWHSEWLWEWLMVTCKNFDLSIDGFFTVVDLLYFMTGLIAVRNFTPNNILLGLLFMFASLMFYTFAINGIRNGLACHIVLLAISLYLMGNYPLSIILFAMAFGIHRSVALPIASFIVAFYFIKDVKWAIWGWISSIFLSLVAGGWFTSFFAGLGFDDRMAQYTQETDYSQFSRSGFRWDFLLYSAMPVLLGYYIFIKKEIKESWYRVLFSTYCLANSFWVLVIRAEFSNRFAYLSWFLYPIVIAYPLIQMPIWEDQDRQIAYIMFAYVGFTMLMYFIWNYF